MHEQQVSELWVVKVQVITKIATTDGDLLNDVHEAYVSMAVAGQCNAKQREIFDKACDQFVNEQQVDAVMLDGTDLALVYETGATDFELIDCAQIQVDALFIFSSQNE